MPLSYKAGYPNKEKVKMIKERVEKRFKGNAEIDKMRCRAMFMMGNPEMWETHMQVMSDCVIAKDGLIGTVRGEREPQTVKVYYGN